MTGFCDKTSVKLGEVTVVVRRLTVAEIRAARVAFHSGSECLDEEYDRLLREHVTLEDGSPIDPSELSMRQMQKLVTELVGIPEGSGISDFIGLLC